MSLGRVHLFEWEDFAWFPSVLRDGGTAFLAFAERHSGHARCLAPVLSRALTATGSTAVLDLCSGAGGPAGVLSEALSAEHPSLAVTLTDRYPNPAAWAALEASTAGRVKGLSRPVDARAVPDDLDGFRTLFNAFHHFRPDDARAILADAMRARRPIGVFEVVSRELPMLVGLLASPVTATLSMPFWRPFRWAWVPLTLLVPVMQLFILWDGLVSWLRIYDLDALRALTADLDDPDWVWELGKTRLGAAPLHATWLIGRPRRPDEATPPSALQT
ncbi:MAG: hypothetical protein JNK72_10855 [Myxococcales bacterium]|nr:hypothetical protein [Myxococcales bacterium]